MATAGLEEYPERLPFSRIAEGSMVDLADYLPYLIDDPKKVPTRPGPQPTGKSFGKSRRRYFVRQHVYFTELAYRQTAKPSEDRDRRLVALRNSSHSQMVMRKFMEDQLHVDKEPDVEPPDEEHRDNILIDYFNLDVVAAATLGIHEVKNPKTITSWEDRNIEQRPEIEALTSKQKIEIFKKQRETTLDTLQMPLIVPEIVIASALMRAATHLGDLSLRRMAQERHDGVAQYYPLLAPPRGLLRNVATHILEDAVEIRQLSDARLKVQALQTGVDPVESKV